MNEYTHMKLIIAPYDPWDGTDTTLVHKDYKLIRILNSRFDTYEDDRLEAVAEGLSLAARDTITQSDLGKWLDLARTPWHNPVSPKYPGADVFLMRDFLDTLVRHQIIAIVPDVSPEVAAIVELAERHPCVQSVEFYAKTQRPRYYVNLKSYDRSFAGDRSAKIYIDHTAAVVKTKPKGTMSRDFSDSYDCFLAAFEGQNGYI
jgi:hypothetical protein